jgi:hypothetical protein
MAAAGWTGTERERERERECVCVCARVRAPGQTEEEEERGSEGEEMGVCQQPHRAWYETEIARPM